MIITKNQLNKFSDELSKTSMKTNAEYLFSLSEFQHFGYESIYNLARVVYNICASSNILKEEYKLNIIACILRKYGVVSIIPEEDKSILRIKNLQEDIKMEYYYKYLYLNKYPF